MPFPTWQEMFRDIATNATKAVVDASGVNDAVAQKCLECGLIRRGPLGQAIAFTAFSLFITCARKNVSTDSLVGHVLAELISDLPSEIAASAIRLLKNQKFLDIAAEAATEGGLACSRD